MLYGFRADIAPINSSLFIRFEIGSKSLTKYVQKDRLSFFAVAVYGHGG